MYLPCFSSIKPEPYIKAAFRRSRSCLHSQQLRIQDLLLVPKSEKSYAYVLHIKSKYVRFKNAKSK